MKQRFQVARAAGPCGLAHCAPAPPPAHRGKIPPVLHCAQPADSPQMRSPISRAREPTMDPNSFDTLARSLGSSSTRRSVVSGSLAGLFALLLPIGDAGAKRGRRHGNAHGSGGAHDRPKGHPLEAEKKRHRKKKKKPAPCASQCAGKMCGPDGCGGSCGACGGSTSCRGGQCVPDSGACTPACGGGQVCQGNGACACPAGSTLSCNPLLVTDCMCCPAGQHYCNGACRECCSGADCNGGGRYCEGNVCRCPNQQQDCGGICYSCCTSEHCAVYGKEPGDGFFCNAIHACVCSAARPTECRRNDNFSSFCTNVLSDPENCGRCGLNCRGGACIDGGCVAP